jgi:plasmid stabilization system protein ParE
VRRLLLRPAAAADVEEAYRWYEAQRQGLGEEFLLALGGVLRSIRENPDRYPIIYRQTRHALLGRFPYLVYYRLVDQGVMVVACMHASRDPRRWHVR